MAWSRMGAIGRALAAGLLAASAARAGGDGEAVTLRESARAGDSTRVIVELKAEGSYLPGGPPGAASPPAGGSAEEARPKGYKFKVETRNAFDERVLAVGPAGGPTRSARRVIQAASAVGGEIRPISMVLRPEVATLVAEVRRGGQVVVSSPAGPLTRPELEVVQGPLDPLDMPAFLPEKPVKVGETWTVGDAAARSVSGYDALAANALEATLEAVDADNARIKLVGSVRGAALGGEGSMAVAGTIRFDRKAGRVDRVSLSRAEARQPGPVEEGLDVRSTVTFARGAFDPPDELNDAAVAALPAGPDPAAERLRFTSTDGRYTLVHDRSWHIHSDNDRATVFKKLDRGELVAQCNIVAGPNAGRGRHQDPAQFREDVTKALGDRFRQILGAGVVDGAPAGNYRYKVGVQGQEGDVGVLWYYYLIAGPEGDQLLATFTLGVAQQAAFGTGDEELIGGLEWVDRAGDARAEADRAPDARP